MWSSKNPDRAFCETVFLAQSPLWMVAVAVVMFSGVIERWGDTELLLFGFAMAALPCVAPAVWARHTGRPVPGYALRFNVAIAIIVFIGSYVWSHYFFDLMGMRYTFPTTIHLEAEGLGRKQQEVPLFLYPLTHAYFVTYYTAMICALRGASALLGPAWWWRAAAVVVISYAVAFGETFFMDVDALSPYFGYANRNRMLALGSIPYGLVFVASLPLLAPMDEDPDAPWTLGRTVITALACGMLGMLALDGWALVFGPLS